MGGAARRASKRFRRGAASKVDKDRGEQASVGKEAKESKVPEQADAARHTAVEGVDPPAARVLPDRNRRNLLCPNRGCRGREAELLKR